MVATQNASGFNDADFSDLWSDALDAYQTETKRELPLAKLKDLLKTPEDLLKHIESQGEQFTNFRSKHRKLWDRMHAFVAPVTAIGNTASTAVNSLAPFGPPASAVLGAVVYLIKAADGVKDAYDWIQTLFGEFEMFATRLQQYFSPSHQLNPGLQKKLIAILTCLLRLLGRSEALIKGGRFREYLRCAFLGKDDKTKGLLDDLNSQLKDEQGLVLALTFAATRNAEDFSKAAAEDVAKVGAQVGELLENQKLQDAEMEQHRDEEANARQVEHMKQMLDTPAMDLVERLLSTQSNDLVDGTGAWLEKEKLFNDWISGRAPILWIFGGPGSGKSFLATWTIQHLRGRFEQTVENFSGTAVAYFFIKDYDAALLDPNNILKTMALQIAEVDSAFRNHAAAACKNRASTVTENDTWEKILLGFYSRPEAQGHYAILILDGLDEAPSATRKKLLAMAKSVTSTNRGNNVEDRISFGIFGRPELRSDFEFKRQEKYIEVLPSKNQDDVNTFILSRLPELALVKEMKSRGATGQHQAKKMCRTIAKQVLQGADGVFLWVKLLMKELEELNQIQIGRVLKNPPRSLDDMIRKLFHRIYEESNGDIVETNKMLMLICFARRPLLFGELKLFLSLPNQQPDILLWRNIRGRFASLFELKFPSNCDPDLDQDDGEGAEDETGDEDATEGNDGTDEQNNQEGETTQDGDVDDKAEQEASEVDNDDDAEEDEDVDEDDNDSGDGDDDDNDDTDDEDFDFGDDSVIQTATFDLGYAPRDDKEAEKYENTLHDTYSQLFTSIRFTHQRIKDFLLIEGDPGKAQQDNSIHINTGRAEIDMTICCLQALRQGHESFEHRAYLVQYPARYFMIHLANIKEEYLTPQDIEEIIGGLVQLFYNEETSKALIVGAGEGDEVNIGRDEYWATWMNSQTHRQLLQKWLRRPEAEASFTNEATRTWIRQAGTSVLRLLEPMMKGVAQIWLTKTGYDDEHYRDKSHWLVDVLCAYLSMDESGVITDEKYREWSWIRGNYSLAETAPSIYAAAEWAGLEKTTHWYTGLGWILMDSGFPDEAIEEYNKAIALDATAWVAMEGKARCLAGEEKYEEAIETMTNATKNLPASMESLNAFLLPQISGWKEAMGDADGSYETAVAAFNADCWSVVAQDRYISVLCARNDCYEEVIDTLKWMHGSTTDNGHTLLFQYFIAGYGYDKQNEIGLAAKKCGRPEFVLESIDASLAWSRDNRSNRQLIWRTQYSAHVRYYFYGNDDEAVKLWEECLELISNLTPQQKEDYLSFKITIVNTLSRILFDMAMAAKQVDQGYSRFAKKLKELSVALDSSLEKESFEFYNVGYPALLWGRWSRECENADVSVWRQPFRASLLDLMAQLDDDDPANDTTALQRLARGLLQAGDRKNAGAILAIIFKLLEDYIEERDEQAEESAEEPADESVPDDLGDDENKTVESNDEPSETTTEDAETTPTSTDSREVVDTTCEEPEQDDDTPQRKPKGSELKLAIDKYAWRYSCDNCRRRADSVAEMHFCEICEDVNWCGECLTLVKNDELSQRQCNPHHAFYRAWPIPEEARNSAATWLEGEPELRRDWLDDLRKDWL